MPDFVGAVDQGTTSSRFMIFDHSGNEVGKHQLEHEQILPQAGWVEHNPVEIWERTASVIQTALNQAGLTASDLAALRRPGSPESKKSRDRDPPICYQLICYSRRSACRISSGPLTRAPQAHGL